MPDVGEGGAAALTTLRTRTSRSEPQARARSHHRRPAGVHRVHDLGFVDALEVGRRDAEIGVAQLALDDVERDAPRGPSRWRERDAAGAGQSSVGRQLLRRVAAADTGRRPRPPPIEGPSITQKSVPTGIVARRASQGRRCSQPQSSMPTSRRLSPLPLRTSMAPRRSSRSLSARASASWMRSPAGQSTTISSRRRRP